MGCSTLASSCSGKPIPIYTLPYILDIVLAVFLRNVDQLLYKIKTCRDIAPTLLG